LAEITGTNAPAAAPARPRLYEITPVWESGELGALEVTVPEGIAKPGRTYRARARTKDDTGRWSHWSSPVEFVAGN
jgi:hypothetical protein